MVSDNSVLTYEFTHDMTREPYSLTVKCFNYDDTYPHTIRLGVEMRGKPSDLPPQLAKFFDSLTR